MIQPDAFIHPKAHVEDSIIGAGSKVWQFASVNRGAVLGRDCSVAPGAMLDGCRFGDRCRIGPSVSMGPGFKIGHSAFIGPNVVFANDAWPASDKEGWSDEPFRAGSWAVVCGDRVSIGAGALIMPGVVIGDDAVVAGHAFVDRDVPAGHLWTHDGKTRPLPPREKRRRMRFANVAASEEIG